jgi:hypothetical protein
MTCSPAGRSLVVAVGGGLQKCDQAAAGPSTPTSARCPGSSVRTQHPYEGQGSGRQGSGRSGRPRPPSAGTRRFPAVPALPQARRGFATPPSGQGVPPLEFCATNTRSSWLLHPNDPAVRPCGHAYQPSAVRALVERSDPATAKRSGRPESRSVAVKGCGHHAVAKALRACASGTPPLAAATPSAPSSAPCSLILLFYSADTKKRAATLGQNCRPP